jgi:hypothetical protein
MARSVSDVAVSLGIMTGVDPADDATKKSQGKFEKDYTKFLNADALKGARIGVARDFMGADPDVDWVFEVRAQGHAKGGRDPRDVRYPKWFLDSSNQAVFTLYPAEFKVQIADYLKTTGPKYPKNLDQLIEAAENYRSMGNDGAGPNLSRWTYFKNVEAKADALTDPRYLALKNYYLPMTRGADRRHRRQGQTRRHRLSDPDAPSVPDRRAAGPAARLHAEPDRHRQPRGLPGPDRAGGLHHRRSAGHGLVLRHGLQRTEAAGAWLTRCAVPVNTPGHARDLPRRAGEYVTKLKEPVRERTGSNAAIRGEVSASHISCGRQTPMHGEPQCALFAAFVSICVSFSALAQSGPAAAPMIHPEKLKQIAPSVWIIPDESRPMVPNVGFVVGQTGVLVVDTGMGDMNGAIVAGVARKLAPDLRVYVGHHPFSSRA